VILAIVLFSPWLPLWFGFSLVLSLFLPVAILLRSLEELFSTAAIVLYAIFHLCATIEVITDIALCLIYVVGIFLELDVPFVNEFGLVVPLIIARIVLTIIGLFPSILALYYLPSSTGNGSGQKKSGQKKIQYGSGIYPWFSLFWYALFGVIV